MYLKGRVKEARKEYVEDDRNILTQYLTKGPGIKHLPSALPPQFSPECICPLIGENIGHT